MPINSKWFGAMALALAAAVASPAQQWRQVGPPGGTVISLEADPRDVNKIYLGTSDGHVFFSSDEGQHLDALFGRRRRVSQRRLRAFLEAHRPGERNRARIGAVAD